jgi:hypothetical protein
MTAAARTPARAVVAVVAMATMATGCAEESSSGKRAPAAVERQLPTDLYLANLCPRTETPPRIVRRLRRQAEVLLSEARAHPDWLVEWTYYDDHGEDVVREITIRQLAREHLTSIDDHGSPCEPELRARLAEVVE